MICPSLELIDLVKGANTSTKRRSVHCDTNGKGKTGSDTMVTAKSHAV